MISGTRPGAYSARSSRSRSTLAAGTVVASSLGDLMLRRVAKPQGPTTGRGRNHRSWARRPSWATLEVQDSPSQEGSMDTSIRTIARRTIESPAGGLVATALAWAVAWPWLAHRRR